MSDAATERLKAGFAVQDNSFATARTRAEGLRIDRAKLMEGWADLVAAMDFQKIAERAMVLAQIDRELARTGG